MAGVQDVDRAVEGIYDCTVTATTKRMYISCMHKLIDTMLELHSSIGKLECTFPVNVAAFLWRRI